MVHRIYPNIGKGGQGNKLLTPTNMIHTMLSANAMLSARPKNKLRCGNCTSNRFLAVPDLQGYAVGQLGDKQRQGGSVSCGPTVQAGVKPGSDASDCGRP